ncbi:MAG: hypothetical protein ACLFNS_00945 [Desulfobacterales bacterium]
MKQHISVTVRAYEELNAYLPAENRKTDFLVNLEAGADVRCLLSRLGIPEAQVDLILVNERSAALDRFLKIETGYGQAAAWLRLCIRK